MKSNGSIEILTIDVLHASTGASSVALVSGVSTIGTALPISASFGVVSTISTCVGACLLLTSK